ncbi:MAG: hypothetical protein A2293_08810 [Elusimicrobia bacterium RIFOXYB2_FULL_49_7]|nr:MAG: hypothetical protein A2293_08810 [Elusimicrobia bacterium RIFOXYB2_FULL_49_7]
MKPAFPSLLICFLLTLTHGESLLENVYQRSVGVETRYFFLFDTLPDTFISLIREDSLSVDLYATHLSPTCRIKIDAANTGSSLKKENSLSMPMTLFRAPIRPDMEITTFPVGRCLVVRLQPVGFRSVYEMDLSAMEGQTRSGLKKISCRQGDNVEEWTLLLSDAVQNILVHSEKKSVSIEMTGQGAPPCLEKTETNLRFVKTLTPCYLPDIDGRGNALFILELDMRKKGTISYSFDGPRLRILIEKG